MDRLVFGMHHLNITQAGSLIDGKQHLSHKNAALDMAGSDSGKDFYFAKSRMKCIGQWKPGYGTYFFTFVDSSGSYTKMRLADGSDKYVVIAMTHSSQQYVKTVVNKIYEVGTPLYEEGGLGANGAATFGNHIHLEVAVVDNIADMPKTKAFDTSMKCYRMKYETNPVNCFYILDGYTTVVNDKGLGFKHCSKIALDPVPDTSDKGYMLGVDISSHQSGINVAKLKNTEFVIVKATEGFNWTDPSFKSLYQQAKEAGKLLGTYYFARPKNNNAVDDAEYYVSEVAKVKGSSDPVYVLDWECDPTSKTEWALAWLDRVAELTGTTPLIYMNLSCCRAYDWSKVASKYPLWLAQYPVSRHIYDYAKGSLDHSAVKYWNKPIMWQFTNHGRITGYSDDLDCNIFYGSRAEWLALANPEEETVYIEASKLGLNIRSKPVNGTIIGFIQKGSRALVTGFTEQFESDGYLWAMVKYRNITGYCQCDMKSYRLEMR